MMQILKNLLAFIIAGISLFVIYILTIIIVFIFIFIFMDKPEQIPTPAIIKLLTQNQYQVIESSSDSKLIMAKVDTNMAMELDVFEFLLKDRFIKGGSCIGPSYSCQEYMDSLGASCESYSFIEYPEKTIGEMINIYYSAADSILIWEDLRNI